MIIAPSIAIFRREVDRLFRIANVDFYACVGPAELANWSHIAIRIRDEVAALTCRRGTAEDMRRHAHAMELVELRLADAARRQPEPPAPAATVRRPALTLIIGGKAA